MTKNKNNIDVSDLYIFIRFLLMEERAFLNPKTLTGWFCYNTQYFGYRPNRKDSNEEYTSGDI